MADSISGFRLASNGINLSQTSSGENKTGENSVVDHLRYPYNMKIDRDTDYLEIKIAKYQAPGFGLESNTAEAVKNIEENKDSPGTYKNLEKLNVIGSLPTGSEKNKFENPIYYIYLPIPQSISDTNSVSWGPDTLDPLSAFGISFGKDLLSSGFDVRTVVPAYINKITSNTNLSENAKNALIAAVSNRAYGALGGNVSTTSVISRATGQVFNPNLELLFNGVNLRSFPFTFDFASRNQSEARIVKKIIRAFKKSMTAKSSTQTSTAGVFIGPPDIFQLTYKRGPNQHPFLNTFKPMALTDMQLNYTGSNTYATYSDGTPVHIQMSLTFTELNPIFNEDYNEDDIGVGF